MPNLLSSNPCKGINLTNFVKDWELLFKIWIISYKGYGRVHNNKPKKGNETFVDILIGYFGRLKEFINIKFYL